jgi:hypothetical protein
VPDENDSSAVTASSEQINAVMRAALKIPKAWAITMAVAAVLSAVHVSVSTGGDVGGSFAPSALSGVLIALIWLPALLRIVALAGGGIKTPAGEASTGGLLALIASFEPETKRDALPSLLAALGSPEIAVDAERRTASKPIRRDLEMQLAAASLPTMGVREQLAEFAHQYELTRTEEPSRDRTLRMTTLMAEARAAARATPLPMIDLRHMLSSDSDGERVIAIALVQDQPDERLFDLILPAITESRSAFEQYQALGAALELAAMLDPGQQSQLRVALKEALADKTRDIHADTSRARLVEAIEDALRGT